jgi:hypothetical protein
LRLFNTIGQLDCQMTNRPVIHWLTSPSKVAQHHEHEMILAQDVRNKTPYSAGSSDPGQMFEQGRPALLVPATSAATDSMTPTAVAPLGALDFVGR